MFFCFTFGFEQFKRKSRNQVYTCPHCSAQDVYLVKANDCFTFCFIPLIPCSGTKQLYECYTCGWVNVNQPPF
ncbi:hypothetical protein PHYBLDRAFT_137862 [Phycomyces blakesleeanus NRRL 1555(-)]|uniref:Zinc-ribbon 15 domain-containing protein n=1 Tax=Phycomyces blakesleeanus (strain ATCC 8743b / DSM 1359 / FGSC 10004 / NBRC 33097 / NRRL 1555) TaxID=763407 RepID=A0A167QUT8_PHYB8|nr:hypothetical protein PHYBLDRAFT_137862 [Phycomyces blakesleeanus NRRL 1555(-)]OAD80310.1 hypothetical protein PHYBLDRAFT_137862 [Phycomyces blakesleeanus NRRL 1555(-)]|eukprot:XP_018298350.1 hypothetical protein PHYBLDRAFT_137862 [Phycomyces blakesleeanus NRRL 1555(-)]